jgi:hypothetical protein
MLECKMISRKPFICYSVVLDSRKVFLVKSGFVERSKRWKMIVSPDEGLFFPSKRSALHFFQTGEKFKTKPVYASGKGKIQKRIR